jgi:mannan endo-1,4-beta-mannosidase
VSPAIAQVCPGCFRYEAENAQTKVGVNVVNTTTQGNSGTGYVTGFDTTGDHFLMNVNVPSGLHELWVGYRVQTGFGDKGYQYRVGNTYGTGTLEESGIFKADRAALFNLSGGTTTLGVYKDWGFHDIDYMEFRPFTPPPILPISSQLTDSQADANTQHLMNYMTSIYGQKTLAGHQHDESKNLPFPSSTYLNLSGGLKPALRSSDFMEYSPSRLAFGANPRNESEESIKWAKANGGVMSMTWHWNAPANLVNTPCGQNCGPNDYPWWRGFYTQGTTFGFDSQGNDILLPQLISRSGPQFDLIKRDVDAIAVQLQKFEDAGVPVIWRPLHEAQGNASGTSGSGAWFWWGAHGPTVFKELWQYMHERLTDDHGLHNLIWEFTSSTKSGHLNWYPGDEYVDMIGLDVYTDPSSSMSGEWYDILAHYNGRKMIALSESGTLPNADAMDLYGINWSYFSLWKDGFLDDFTAQQVQTLLGDEDIITEKELPILPWSALDYNRDGEIGAADYALWRKTNGLTVLNKPADGNLDGLVNATDYSFWSNNFGRMAFNLSGSGGTTSPAVPEPSSFLLLVSAVFCFGLRRIAN